MMKNGTRRAFLRSAGRLLRSEGGRLAGSLGLWFAGGFCLAAASIARSFQPLALALVCAGRGGWRAVSAALGGALGYLWFWGAGAGQAVLWMLLGLPVSLLLGDRGISRRQLLMLPACAAVVVSGSGVLMLFRWGDQTPVPIYLLRVGLSLGATLIFRLWLERRGSWADWLAQGLFVLSLGQIDFGWINLGSLAAGWLGSQGALASAVLAGLGLELASPRNAGMTGALCLGFCLRLIPHKPKWLDIAAPALAWGAVMALSGRLDLRPVPGLLLGGMARMALPGLGKLEPKRRRGEAAVAQLRLEQMALGLRHMEQSLLLTAPVPRIAPRWRSAAREPPATSAPSAGAARDDWSPCPRSCWSSRGWGRMTCPRGAESPAASSTSCAGDRSSSGG